MADIVDLATTTTLNDTDTVVLQPVGDVEPVRMAGSTMRTEFKGDQGDQGGAGQDGADGSDGAPGAAGPTGSTGPGGSDGADGSDGSDGSTGPAGSTGPVGPTGAAGTDGSDGSDGSTGPQGLYTVDIYRTVTTGTTPATPTGGTVDVGTGTVIISPVNWRSDVPTPGAGETLFIARTTVNPATQSGNITPTWSTPFEAGGDGPAGPAGPVGPVGPAGAAGLNGDPGPAGQDGNAGADGSDGSDGSTGPTGAAGQDGSDGADGQDGADGADGTDGVDGGGGGLTAAAIAALSEGATNSNTEIPSAHEGDLGKISIANIHAYMESSVGLGPRINPGPSLAAAGQVPAVNAAGDAYELITVEGDGDSTFTVIAGPVDAAASLSGQLQYNPGSKDVEVCINDGHVTVAPVGTWDYIPFNADFSIVQTRGSVLLPVVGQYIYDEGNDEFYNWVVVGTDVLGNFVLGWRRVNPSTALSFARRTGTGIVVYWLGDQVSDDAALAYLGTQFPTSFNHANTDVFYLRNDTIRRLETFTSAGVYVDHWLWEPVIRYTVPAPTPHTANEAVVVNALGTGHTTAYLPSRNDLVTHVAQIPDATAMSPELIKLEHGYAFGVRQDIVLRVATDGNIEGYLDLRLGEAVGSFSFPTPVVRIRAILNGINVHTWYTIFFFEEELAAEFDRVWLDNEELTLGPVFAANGLWARRFTTQPTTTLQIDTDIAFNMRRAAGDTFFHTNDAGIRYQSGLYEKYQIRDDGDYAYEILSGPRIQHSDSVGAPLDEPTRNGQFNVDNLGRVWVGLVDRHILTTDAAATSVPLLFDQYIRDPDTEADIHAQGGLGGFTWIVGVGNRELMQVLSNTPSDIDEHRMWVETWDLAATRWAMGSG